MFVLIAMTVMVTASNFAFSQCFNPVELLQLWTGVGVDDIEKINTKPEAFSKSKEVIIVGVVTKTRSIPMADDYYIVKDDDGNEIAVFCSTSLPLVNDQVAVKGTVESGNLWKIYIQQSCREVK